MQSNIPKQDILNFLLGKKKAQLFEYCLKKKSFYQAQAAFDLHWSVSTTQYYLKQFVHYDILTIRNTSYKTYYQLNQTSWLKILTRLKS